MRQQTRRNVKTYGSPQQFKAGLEQRIRNWVDTGGVAIDRVRQFIIYDRFVARLQRILDDVFILKGGFVLELRLEAARMTKDVDMTLFGDPHALLERLQAAARLDLGDHLMFEVTGHPKGEEMGSPELPYQGRRYRCACRLAGRRYGNVFGLDVAFASQFAGRADTLAGSDALSFIGIEPIEYRVIPREAHLAEKLHAYSYPRPPDRPNARIKDLPDIALLATTPGLSAAAVREAIRFTFAYRSSHPVPPALADPPPDWRDRYAALAKHNGLRWQTLDDVYAAARAFIDPILADERDATWDPTTWTWQ